MNTILYNSQGKLTVDFQGAIVRLSSDAEEIDLAVVDTRICHSSTSNGVRFRSLSKRLNTNKHKFFDYYRRISKRDMHASKNGDFLEAKKV